MTKKFSIILFTALVFMMLLVMVYFLYNADVIPKPAKSAESFGIETVKSSVDFNSNGVDDYTEIMLGAREDALNMPEYNGDYVAGGYPPDDVGVCTDLVWRAFKKAGYSLKDMLDRDILLYPSDYPDAYPPDSNIDFRRVKNLKVFFEKYAQSLTTNIQSIEEWQPGDIVIFGADAHIGIVSDKRNNDGQTYILHNAGQKNREQDYLKKHKPTAHYRFDAAKIPHKVLCAWAD